MPSCRRPFVSIASAGLLAATVLPAPAQAVATTTVAAPAAPHVRTAAPSRHEVTKGHRISVRSLASRPARRTTHHAYPRLSLPAGKLPRVPRTGERSSPLRVPRLPNARAGGEITNLVRPSTGAVAASPPKSALSRGAATPAGAGPLLATRQATGFGGVSESTVVPGGCSPSAPPCIEPPDPWVGVGPDHVVQAVNTLIRITDKAGTKLVNDTDFATFFGEPADQEADADPHVSYDAESGRWLASALSYDCTAGHLYLGVSDTDDPTGDWTIYRFDYAGVVPDYPAFGTSTDKIVLSVNEFTIDPVTGGCEVDEGSGAASLRVVDRADAIDGDATVASVVLGPDTDRLAWRPGFALGPGVGTDVYAVGIGLGDGGETPGAMIYATISGTVGGADVAIAERDLTDDATLDTAPPGFVNPPEPFQVGGDQIAAATDGRPTDALWSDGHLYVVSTFACQSLLTGDVYDCVRLTDLDTRSDGDPLQDFAYFAFGFDSYMGGIGIAGDGTLHVVFSRSNEVSIPSTWDAARLPTDPPNTLRDERRLRTGLAAYAGERWGDYVGVARDPSDPTAVWQADEVPTANGSWTTWVSKVTLTPIGDHEVTRISGSNRYETAAALSAATFPANVDAVYVATGENFPDALAGGPAAADRNAPLLLVKATSIPAPTATELTRLAPKTIYVLGGTGTISDGVKTALQAYTTTHTAGSVVRLSGSDRYRTAAAISRNAFQPGVDVVLVAIGTNFPDALAGAPAAALLDGPLLLVTPTSIPSATATELTRLKPVLIVVLGGGISSKVESSLARYTLDGARDFVARIAGSNRYETAAFVAGGLFPANVPVTYVATGTNFPDALAAGPAAGIEGSPVLLVSPTSIPTSVATELGDLEPHRIVVLGGTGSVSNGVQNALGAFLGS